MLRKVDVALIEDDIEKENCMDILNKIGKLVQDPSVQVDITGFIFALIISALAGAIVSILYQIFYEHRATGSQIHRCFLLLSPAITALFIAIQFSLPLSLGLLGALSIIRFRTPIKEPEEVGFIMLTIAGAVVCATFQFLLLLVLFVLAAILLKLREIIPSLLHSKRKDGMLLISLNTPTLDTDKDNIIKLLDKRFTNGNIESISFVENLTTVQYSFTGMEFADLSSLNTQLNEITSVKKLNLFFNRQGTLF